MELFWCTRKAENYAYEKLPYGVGAMHTPKGCCLIATAMIIHIPLIAMDLLISPLKITYGAITYPFAKEPEAPPKVEKAEGLKD